jgi:hypothetical protein
MDLLEIVEMLPESEEENIEKQVLIANALMGEESGAIKEKRSKKF